MQTALGLVAAGIGITLVPASVQRLHRDDVRYVPVDAAGFVSPVIMSYRAGDVSPYLLRGGGVGDAAERGMTGGRGLPCGVQPCQQAAASVDRCHVRHHLVAHDHPFDADHGFLRHGLGSRSFSSRATFATNSASDRL